MRLDINYRKKNVKNTNIWRLNNTLLNNQVITEEIKEEIKKYLETNDNENMKTQNLWDAAKAILRGKFIAIQSYLKKQEKSQINNLTLHLKQLEKRTTKHQSGTSLVAQWLRIRLPMQGIRVPSLVLGDPTCRGATKPACHNY